MESILVVYSDILQAKDFVINKLENNNSALIIGESFIQIDKRIYAFVDINDTTIAKYKETHHPELIYCTLTCTANRFYNAVVPLVANEFDNIIDIRNKVRWIEY